MKNNKYDTLERILENIHEKDANLEPTLAAHPEYADELRPLVESALDAQAIASVKIPDEITRRGKLKLLEHAAKMRDTTSKPRASLLAFRLASVALSMVLIFFLSGAGIISASATSLPGDSLYTVKRSWERATLWLADEEKASSLKMKYEEERREEVQELLGKKRLAEVRFEGAVISISENKWNVAGAPVILSAETKIDLGIVIGADVTVSGQTQADGTVLATAITLNTPIPPPISTEISPPSKKESGNKAPEESPKKLDKNENAAPDQGMEGDQGSGSNNNEDGGSLDSPDDDSKGSDDGEGSDESEGSDDGESSDESEGSDDS